MLALALAACLASAARAEEAPPPSRLAVGANVVGGQIDYQFSPSWRGEARLVTGRQAASGGTISSQVAGLRLYRLFGSGATRFFLGGEGAFVTAAQKNTSYRASGPACGAFLGVERRITRRIWLEADAGPYAFSLKESATHAKETSVDFVLNSSVMVYLF